MNGNVIYVVTLPSGDCVVRGVLVIRRVGGGEVGGHAGERLQRGVGRGHGAPPVAVLVPEQRVGQTVHGHQPPDLARHRPPAAARLHRLLVCIKLRG